VFDGQFVEGVKFMTNAPRKFFVDDHDHKRRVGDSSRMYNTRGKKFVDYFLHLIFLCKGMVVGTNIGRKPTTDERNGMIMNTKRRGKSLGSRKK
jgi:hypothetical protein